MPRGQYKPRRAGARWLVGAPDYVLDVWDNKGRTTDRYTVYFGGEFLIQDATGTWVQYLAMSDAPTHPQGFSQWASCTAQERASFAYRRPDGNRRIRWADLPAHIQQHVIQRATAED